MREKRIVVIGLGNPILGDDSVGWIVTDLLAKKFPHPPVEIKQLSVGGLRLMEEMQGFDEAILVDAIHLADKPAGSVLQFPLSEMQDLSTGHTASSHDTSLQAALRVGENSGVKLPEQIQVVAVVIETAEVFTEQLSPEVQAAVPKALDLAVELISELRGGPDDFS